MKPPPKSGDAKLTKREFVLASAAISAAILLAVTRMGACSHRESLESAGETIVDAIIRRDEATLMKYMFESERNLCGVDSSNLKALLGLVVPNARELQIVDRGYLRLESGSALAYTAYMRTPEGAMGGFEVVVHRTDQGPKAFLLTQIVAGSFVSRFAGRYLDKPRQYQVWRPIFDGMSDYGDRIKALGIKGRPSESPNPKLLSWESYRDFALEAAEAGLKPEEENR